MFFGYKNMKEFKVTHIWHDCFLVETPVVNLVFDYWLDSDGEARAVPHFLDCLDRHRPLLVFVSHFHKDHYNPDIFGWTRLFADVRFVVSGDVWKRMRHIVSATSVYKGPKVEPALVTVLHANQCAEVGASRVTAFPTTDVGNAYGVEVCDQLIFHAGDLNLWAWRDDSTPEEVRKAEGDYHACLRDIKAAIGNRTIDYCFFPIDSRIGSGYDEGARIFLRTFHVDHFFAMHYDLGDEAERRLRRADAMAAMAAIAKKS